MKQGTNHKLHLLLIPAVTLFLILSIASSSHAEMYQWKDGKGVTHFTNDIESIPREFRDQARLIWKSKPREQQPTAKTNEEEKIINTDKTPKSADDKKIIIPLRQSGSSLIVSAKLNGSKSALFVVDTGATITTISTKMAEKLNVNLTANSPVLSVQTANGIIDAPLVKLKSLKIGAAEQKDVMVIVFDAVPGYTGLLGLTFLNEYNYSVNPNDRLLILSSLEDASKEKLYGGHGQKWWKRKFATIRGTIGREKDAMAKLKGLLNKTPDEKQSEAIEKNIQNKQKNIRFFEKELRQLKNKAVLSTVPIQWQ